MLTSVKWINVWTVFGTFPENNVRHSRLRCWFGMRKDKGNVLSRTNQGNKMTAGIIVALSQKRPHGNKEISLLDLWEEIMCYKFQGNFNQQIFFWNCCFKAMPGCSSCSQILDPIISLPQKIPKNFDGLPLIHQAHSLLSRVLVLLTFSLINSKGSRFL